MAEAIETNTTSEADARLLALLAEARDAEQAHHDAANAEDETGIEAATERLEGILDAMADLPAAGWTGIAVKAARICRSLYDSGTGMGLLAADVPVMESLAADLARLAPEVRA